jgi:hypothetical protein
MKKLIPIFIFLGGLLVGAVAAGWWSWHVFSQVTVSKEEDAASIAAFQAEWLAHLRLHEPETAIKDIESYMDMQVATIAEWNEIKPPDEKMRKILERWLVPVKVYHESYPAVGDNSVQINAFLVTIPGRRTNSTCKSGICRLDDLRRAKQNSATNSP